MKKLRILIACEESQVVCKAFRAKGHEAYSCDIIECSGGHHEWHIQDDVLNQLNQYWDLVIAHPPCTYMANSGVRWLFDKNGYRNPSRWEKLASSVRFFNNFQYYSQNGYIKKLCIENPIPHKYARDGFMTNYGELDFTNYAGIGKYSQIIQPYQFGHLERKATCLWIYGLKHLKETNNVKAEMDKLPKNKSQRLHYLPPSKDRAKLRSETYTGIANAMADQWG